MSTTDDDDQPTWFSGGASSDSAQPPPARRLEAVPPSEPQPEGPGWFDGEPASPPREPHADATDPRAETKKPSGNGGAKLLFAGTVGAVLLVLGVVAFALANLLGGDPEPPGPLVVPGVESSETAPDSNDPAPAAAPAVTTAGCEPTESPTVTTGDGSGNTDSVAGVVLAFQHNYYVARDAEKIGELLSKDSDITDLDALLEGIDSVPEGTTHCLRIVSDGEGEATVELTETTPDDKETVYKQHVSTTREAGEVRIVTIEDRS